MKKKLSKMRNLISKEINQISSSCNGKEKFCLIIHVLILIMCVDKGHKQGKARY